MKSIIKRILSYILILCISVFLVLPDVNVVYADDYSSDDSFSSIDPYDQVGSDNSDSNSDNNDSDNDYWYDIDPYLLAMTHMMTSKIRIRIQKSRN